MSNQIVAIGLLTPDDLDRLGKNFTRHFPVIQDDTFADLLAKLDEVTKTKVSDGMPESNAGRTDDV